MNIEKIAADAAAVAHEYEQSQDAIAEKTVAEAALLAAVIAKVEPALLAVSSRIRSGFRCWWLDSVRTAKEETYFGERGLLVAGDDHAKREHPSANRGSYGGEGLFLLSDGTFAEVAYSGSWSKWSGEGDQWEAGMLRLAGTGDVARRYDVTEIVEAIGAALERAVGSREKATKAATDRAEAVRAVATLIGGVQR